MHQRMLRILMNCTFIQKVILCLMSPYGLILCLKFIFQGFKVICIHCHVQEQRKQIEPRTRLNKIWGVKKVYFCTCVIGEDAWV